ELQTEPLDLTISRVCGGRTEPPDASIAEVSGDKRNSAKLIMKMQEASREQTGVRDMPKKIWLMRHQNEASNNQIPKRKHPENTTHTGEKRFKCEISKKDFVALPSTHTMNHTNEKPLSFSECNMSFIWPSFLNMHEKIHSGEKPYSCSECGKNFAQSAGLYSHKQIHTGKKPYSSSECGKNFTHSSNLRTHEKFILGRSTLV
uniref:C2H2-type domain-containing protein n=1 Tax=Loa loa TaxID=7209 RepID=A0A1I7VCA6_LOALO